MFPDYNIYSIPLLIFVIQGLILAGLLFKKSINQSRRSFLILAILVLITCYHRTTYTIGFMGWYDTFRNTKINYYLISLVLGVGPLIYFYIKSSLQLGFEWNKKHWLHFLPVSLYVILKLVVLAMDFGQPGFEETQNGPYYLWVMDHLSGFLSFLFAGHLFIYLFYSFKLYYQYRRRLLEEYSNTYKYELRWLRNFLILFTFLFVYDFLQMITDGYIFDLHWTQEWWYQFFSLLVVIYVGVMGYFTPVENLKKIDLSEPHSINSEAKTDNFGYADQLAKVCSELENERHYLDPNLSLSQLSRMVKINTTQLSFIINKGMDKNFNDFINHYRVEAVKKQLVDPTNQHLSILAIAYDSGFNSKATFNRVFKKQTGKSPSEFRK